MHCKDLVIGQQRDRVSWEGTAQEKRKRLEGHPLALARGLRKAQPSLVGWIKEGEGGAVGPRELGLK